jgi:hypothetical protein
VSARAIAGTRSGPRTIFSVRPFQMSSPIALYCLLVVAIAGEAKREQAPGLAAST